MRQRIRRLISRLAAAMHAELIGEIRGQHKKVLARAAESERKLASSTRLSMHIAMVNKITETVCGYW